tara:strand:+ start:926 stop:1138 length:213 start_codon:yes stop_codon:yes gene_type:complete
MYYRDARIAIVMYDITSMVSGCMSISSMAVNVNLFLFLPMLRTYIYIDIYYLSTAVLSPLLKIEEERVQQ